MLRMLPFTHNAKNQLVVTIVRHGETTLNAKRLMQGQTDIPLSDIGKAQAEQLGKSISTKRFTRAYSSDLSRAHETAQLVLHHSKNPLDIILDKRLRERCFGEIEGKHVSELISDANKYGLNIVDYTPKGGESSQEVTHRTSQFFNHLCELADSLDNLEEEHAFIASHGGWMANLMRHLQANETYTLHNFDACKAFKIPPNTGVTRLAITTLNGSNEAKERLIVFDCINDGSHLEGQDD